MTLNPFLQSESEIEPDRAIFLLSSFLHAAELLNGHDTVFPRHVALARASQYCNLVVRCLQRIYSHASVRGRRYVCVCDNVDGYRVTAWAGFNCGLSTS